MIFSGCQSKSKDVTIEEKICPQCGNIMEIFSTDTEVKCDHCGFIAYNDKLSCVQWCQYARQCVGDEMYEKMQQISQRNREKREKTV